LMTTLGYTLGKVAFVRQYFDKFVLAIIVISLLPAISEVLKARRKEPTRVP
jgi:membrane protein DedA with SNARE-associated domain